MMSFLDYVFLDWKSEVWNLDMFCLPDFTTRYEPPIDLFVCSLQICFEVFDRWFDSGKTTQSRYPAKTAKMEKSLFWARTLEQQWENQRIQQW